MNTRPAVGSRVRVAHPGNPYRERRGTVASYSDTWPTIVYVNLEPLMSLGQQVKPAERLRAIAWEHLEPVNR